MLVITTWISVLLSVAKYLSILQIFYFRSKEGDNFDKSLKLFKL